MLCMRMVELAVEVAVELAVEAEVGLAVGLVAAMATGLGSQSSCSSKELDIQPAHCNGCPGCNMVSTQHNLHFSGSTEILPHSRLGFEGNSANTRLCRKEVTERVGGLATDRGRSLCKTREIGTAEDHSSECL